MKQDIKDQIEESIKIKQSFSDELIESIESAANELVNCLENDGKVLVCGNGGSAADSQHLTAELVSKYRRERKGLPVISLTTNTSTLTAIGNDYDFSRVFARQVEALAKDRDVLFAISTSGNSKDVVEAIKEAKKYGVLVIGLVGEDGGEMDGMCDVMLKVPSKDTPRIQESHILIIHIICDLVEQAFV